MSSAEAVFREGVAENDVIGVLAFDQHVGFADRPGVVVPILAEEHRLRIAIELVDVLLRDGEHAAGAAGRIVDGFHDVAVRQVFLRREKQIHHELDHLARSEVFARFLVRLLRADPDQLLEDIAHLHVVDVGRGEVDLRESLDDFVEKILLRHLRDLLVEAEALDDGADVRRESVDVTVEIRRELVRVVEQLLEDRASRDCRMVAS